MRCMHDIHLCLSLLYHWHAHSGRYNESLHLGVHCHCMVMSLAPPLNKGQRKWVVITNISTKCMHVWFGSSSHHFALEPYHIRSCSFIKRIKTNNTYYMLSIDRCVPPAQNGNRTN